MLMLRVITGLVLAPLATLAVFYLPTWGFALVFWVVAALAAFEWANLFKSPSKLVAPAYVGLFGLLVLGAFSLGWHENPAHYSLLLLLGVGFWLAAFVLVLIYPKAETIVQAKVFLFPVGLFVMYMAWLCLMVIRALSEGPIWIVWLFCVVWGTDIGAYFAGRSFGKRALAPSVSPAKTWEGVLGGILLSGIVCGGVVVWWQGYPVFWILVTLLLIVVSVFGDLFESVLKRATGVKDSGAILPGHGGMLDRIDSLIAALPIFAPILLSMN